VRTAQGTDGEQVAPPKQVTRRAQPLLGADDVVDPLAGQEHAAEHRRQRLVEPEHSLLDPASQHQRLAQLGERGEPKRGVTDPIRDFDRGSDSTLTGIGVGLARCVHELDPAQVPRCPMPSARAGPRPAPAIRRRLRNHRRC